MNQNAPKTFTTIDGNTLMSQQFEPLKFSVEKILPNGLFILAGSPKVGKSWLSLDLCQAVATGGAIWDYPAVSGDVLYLALEDNYSRLQGRLAKFETDGQDISRLHMATSSFGIHDGLLEQMNNFLTAYPQTQLIVIDTLEHIRNGGMDKSLYSYDYQDMTKLRQITSKHDVTLLLVHHTRKTKDADPLNKISGSTGLIGAVDGAFVLEKISRIENGAVLTIANRDTENFCFVC
jgi:RecA-family ATPase